MRRACQSWEVLWVCYDCLVSDLWFEVRVPSSARVPWCIERSEHGVQREAGTQDGHCNWELELGC